MELPGLISNNSSLLVPKNTGYTIFHITCIYQITSIGTWVPIHLIIEGFEGLSINANKANF